MTASVLKNKQTNKKQQPRSKHTKGSKEHYLLGQDKDSFEHWTGVAHF